MHRLSALLAVGLSFLLATACNRADRDESPVESEPQVRGNEGLVRPSPITVEGCLTASGDRLVLTQLKPEQELESATETYRLVGMEEELRPHVGRLVRITGEAQPEQVVDVRQSSPPPARTDQPVGTSGRPDPSAGDAQVGTTTTARIEISDLQVRSVSAREEPCTATR
jgi:hypothetical protein